MKKNTLLQITFFTTFLVGVLVAVAFGCQSLIKKTTERYQAAIAEANQLDEKSEMLLNRAEVIPEKILAEIKRLNEVHQKQKNDLTDKIERISLLESEQAYMQRQIAKQEIFCQEQESIYSTLVKRASLIKDGTEVLLVKARSESDSAKSRLEEALTTLDKQKKKFAELEESMKSFDSEISQFQSEIVASQQKRQILESDFQATVSREKKQNEVIDKARETVSKLKSEQLQLQREVKELETKLGKSSKIKIDDVWMEGK